MSKHKAQSRPVPVQRAIGNAYSHGQHNKSKENQNISKRLRDATVQRLCLSQLRSSQSSRDKHRQICIFRRSVVAHSFAADWAVSVDLCHRGVHSLQVCVEGIGPGHGPKITIRSPTVVRATAPVPEDRVRLPNRDLRSCILWTDGNGKLTSEPSLYFHMLWRSHPASPQHELDMARSVVFGAHARGALRTDKWSTGCPMPYTNISCSCADILDFYVGGRRRMGRLRWFGCSYDNHGPQHPADFFC